MNKDGVAAREGAVFSDQYVVLHQISGDPEFYNFSFREKFLVNLVDMLIGRFVAV
jgi:hypothetical protein